MIPQDHQIVIAQDAAAWREWLIANQDTAPSVWVLLAKKGTTEPTTLTYAEGLEEALCSGWIDGQRCGQDAATFAQRYTPRSPRSLWSRRNIDIATRLIGEGRMRPRGQAEIDQARATGRWTAPRPDEADAASDRGPAPAAGFRSMVPADRSPLCEPPAAPAACSWSAPPPLRTPATWPNDSPA